MSYFDRREDESIRYCPVCERRTMQTRPTPVALWTCKDSGHPHPTKLQQELGMMTNDNYETEIRHVARLKLRRACDSECLDTCTCHGRTLSRLVPAIKSAWKDHAVYPSNARIMEVLKEMERDSTIVLHKGCTFYDCTDDEGQPLDHEPKCTHYRWATNVPQYITVDDDEVDNPDFGALEPEPEWSPSGERLRVDRRGYSPRQTVEELHAFYNDREMLPKYEHESRTYIRDDLPALFDCGCSRPKVLANQCDLYGPDGRERGWVNPNSAIFVGEGSAGALANNRYGDPIK